MPKISFSAPLIQTLQRPSDLSINQLNYSFLSLTKKQGFSRPIPQEGSINILHPDSESRKAL